MELDVAVAAEPETPDAHHVVFVVATLKDGAVKGGKAFVCAKQATRLEILVALHRIPHHNNGFIGAPVFHGFRRR